MKIKLLILFLFLSNSLIIAGPKRSDIPETISVKIGAADPIDIDFEEYIRGVVNGEMQMYGHQSQPYLEALKAEAIVARCYALAVGLRKHSGNFILDSDADQKYIPYDGTDNDVYNPAKAGEYVPRVREAVINTTGQVLTAYNRNEDQNEIIMALYGADYPNRSISSVRDSDGTYFAWWIYAPYLGSRDNSGGSEAGANPYGLSHI